MKKIRVMLLINHLADGGAQRVVTLWAQILSDHGYAVTVLTFYPRSDEYPLCSGVQRANLFPSFAIYCATPDQINASQKLLDAYLVAHPQDIVIPLSYKPNLAAARSQQQAHTVITQTLRNSPWSLEKNFDRALRDTAIKQQGSIILQNADQLPYFETPEFAHVKKYLVHNPLNPAINDIAKTEYLPIRKIIAIGRLVPQKNQIMMIEAMQILRDEYHYPCQLDIYGVGPEQAHLQQAIDARGLTQQVVLRGRESDIFHTAVQYDLFIMTSLHEGTPNALLECMGLGLPVIATNCQTGPKELIHHGQNGYLLDDYDAHALAELIMQINDPAVLARLGRQARQDMTRYAPANTGAELMACIQALLGQTEWPWQHKTTAAMLSGV